MNQEKWDAILENMSFKIPVYKEPTLEEKIESDLRIRAGSKRNDFFYSCGTKQENIFDSTIDSAYDIARDIKTDIADAKEGKITIDIPFAEMALLKANQICLQKSLEYFEKLPHIRQTAERMNKLLDFAINSIQDQYKSNDTRDNINESCKQYLDMLKLFIDKLDLQTEFDKKINGAELYGDFTGPRAIRASRVLRDIDESYVNKFQNIRKEFIQKHPEAKEMSEIMNRLTNDELEL